MEIIQNNKDYVNVLFKKISPECLHQHHHRCQRDENEISLLSDGNEAKNSLENWIWFRLYGKKLDISRIDIEFNQEKFRILNIYSFPLSFEFCHSLSLSLFWPGFHFGSKSTHRRLISADKLWNTLENVRKWVPFRVDSQHEKMTQQRMCFKI